MPVGVEKVGQQNTFSAANRTLSSFLPSL